MNHDYFCIDEILSHKLVDFFVVKLITSQAHIPYSSQWRQILSVSTVYSTTAVLTLEWEKGNRTLRQHCQLQHSFSKGKPEHVWDKSTRQYSHQLNCSLLKCVNHCVDIGCLGLINHKLIGCSLILNKDININKISEGLPRDIYASINVLLVFSEMMLRM